MNTTLDSTDISEGLRQHDSLCGEILKLVEREAETLRDPASAAQFDLYQAKKSLLPRLQESVQQIKQHRAAWQKIPAADRVKQPETLALIRQTQDAIMKIIVLDRENEQALLRRGLVPPRHLPPANRQRPHFVAELYRRGHS